MTRTWLSVGAMLALIAGRASADAWDLHTLNDDSVDTFNELLHGTTQTHDLAVRPGPVADQDWYQMPQRPRASYEALIDGVAGDLGIGLRLDRIAVDGLNVLQASVEPIAALGFNRALRWVNTATSVAHERIKVSLPHCGTACGADDVYTIRVRETTVNIARFNSTGTQQTVLLTQNASEEPVDVTASYWNTTGVLLQTGTFSLAPKALSVVNLATTFPNLANPSGSITIAHTGSYGAIVAKAVALEAATGFSFDTPGVYVPY